MNFLAHLYLADNTPDSIIGNMLGDFVGMDFRETYNAEICRGIIQHRKIDRFTDSHPIFLQSKKRISNDYRLLKGVMVDIFYDHYLAKNWPDYSEVTLEEFCSYVYDIFLDYRPNLPPRLQSMIPIMVAENWLLSYREVEGIASVLNGMSRRISRKNNLANGAEELLKHYREFENDFKTFFPKLIAYVNSLE